MMRRKYLPGKLINLTYLISILMVYPLTASPTYDYQYVDGNGNRFNVTKEKLIALQYFPVTPMESSSGLYSGGEKKSIFLNQTQYDAFLKLVSAMKWKRSEEMKARKKGESYLLKREKQKIHFVLFAASDPLALTIENQLRGYLNQMTNPSNPMPNSMVGKKFEISRDESPWLGFTSTYVEEQNGKHIASKSLPAQGYSPIRIPVETVFEDQSLLYRSEKERGVITNADYFSDLERVDVTRLRPTESQVIGKILEPKLRDAQFMIPFLLKGQILITYWHTNSVVECISETKNKNEITYFFSGVHHYYTNEKNSSNFKFHLTFNLDTGLMIVASE